MFFTFFCFFVCLLLMSTSDLVDSFMHVNVLKGNLRFFIVIAIQYDTLYLYERV